MPKSWGKRDVGAERIRSELASRLEQATVPWFSVTIGLAAGALGDELLDVIGLADATMLRGKALGRNRVVVAERFVAGVGPGPNTLAGGG